MRTSTNIRSLVLVLILFAACRSPEVDRDGGTIAPTVRVLFIGNSYTSVNDLPTAVVHLSEASQSPVRFEVGHYTPGGQTWEGDDADPAVTQLIQQGWDYVVLQDQSEQPWTVTGVKGSLISLDAKIRAAGAKTVLFMTWAQRQDVAQANGVTLFQEGMAIDHYYQWSAEVVGASVAPVGRAWERALRDPAMILHASDGSHPNLNGTYLTACVFYATLTGLPPAGLGDGGLGVDAEDAVRLQQVAWDTMVARNEPAAPLVGEWPFASATSGNDLLPSDGVVLGDTVGPRTSPSAATQFGTGRYAAVPYFTGINPARVTVSFYAFRADWSTPNVPTGGAQIPIEPDEYMVGKWQGYAIYQNGATLYAEVHTLDDDAPPRLSYNAAGLAAGWHHIALTYDGVTYALWIDRTQVASATTSGDLRYCDCMTTTAATEPGHFTGIAIGGRPVQFSQSVAGDFPEPFTGALAGLRVYDTALTAAEIQAE